SSPPSGDSPPRIASAGEAPGAASAGEAPAAVPAPGLLQRASVVAFGTVGLLVGLAFLAAVPVLQFLTLGWLLEAEGRLARGEGWRRALPGLRKAAWLGSVVLGSALWLLPVLVLWSAHRDATLLATPEKAGKLGVALLVVASLVACHIALSAARGGRLRSFFWPPGGLLWLARRLLGGKLPAPAALRERARTALASLRIGHYLVLGVKGFGVGLAWLFLPTTLLVLGTQAPPLALLGGLALPFVLPYAVVAQARLAATGDVRTAFRPRELRARLARAPLAFGLALLVVLALALPLYAFKIEALPRDALWLPALLFLAFALPGRLLAGWAHARAERPRPAHWALRLAAVALTLPTGGAYVFFVFFSQYFGWQGTAGLYAQHAFLLPVAFH
ncbi:MAG: hypothetical protein D6731_19055, partial [Planctomycetota bacterium]